MTNVVNGLNYSAREIFKANKEKGFWDNERNTGEMLMLVVSELGEAMEALRKGKKADLANYLNVTKADSDLFDVSFKQYMKDTFEDEIADSIIRLLDMCGGLGIDIDTHINSKLKYNATRPRLHGKQFLIMTDNQMKQFIDASFDGWVYSIAEICHETNRLYCRMVADFSQKPWAECEDWQRKSAIEGVKYRLANPDATPEMMHGSWLQSKLSDGWVYGEVKDADKKTHPCIVPYNELPLNQQLKDYLFGNIVKAFMFQ